MSRSDLHIHSKYSNRPSEWFLRRIGASESFVEPSAIYETCKQKGMDYITITDHNSISGALEIAHLPGVFISSEITTYFPEDNCKIHCLVMGITERQFEQIQKIRGNIYELRKYMLENNIIHSVAHPLLSVNDKLTLQNVEKLILLFKRFEVLNGARNQYLNQTTRLILENLTPAIIEEMAGRYNLCVADKAWEKFFTGGSDDHSGVYIAQSCTSTDRSSNVFDFLQDLREGRHKEEGIPGSSLTLAHSLYRIAYGYYCSKFSGNGHKIDPIKKMLGRFAGHDEKQTSKFYIPQPVVRFFTSRKKRNLTDIEKILVDGFASPKKTGFAPTEDKDQYHFHIASSIGHNLGFAFTRHFIENIEKGRLVESIQSLSSIGPVALGFAPYITAFFAQHKDNKLLKSFENHFNLPDGKKANKGKKVWFTDTLDDVNGVSRTISTLANLAGKDGQITVCTSLSEKPEADFPLYNFEPVGVFNLPEYESQKIVFPPFLTMLEFVEKQGFDEIIVSTPGPVGLVGLLAGHLLNIDLKGIYHTDFPQYVHHLTDDDHMEGLAWKYMLWFYGYMKKIFVPSRFYFDLLVEKGFEKAKLDILERGVDTSRFTPQKRDAKFWGRYGINGGFKFIYVGRVSTEKNIENLLHAFTDIEKDLHDIHLIIVGDGPLLGTLKARFNLPDIIFTGYLKGEELSAAYASSDVFVFPSMTDTFGNAVLEAHSSGLPAIVSNKGGPVDIVTSHNSGLIVDAKNSEEIAQAMRKIYKDEHLRSRLAANALSRARESKWENILKKLLA